MIEEEDVISITQNIFSTMLQMDAQPIAAEFLPTTGPEMIGCIQIVGEWSGAVLLSASADFATAAGSRMLMLKISEIVEEDRQDTLAELTNMIGGNIKSIVPSPSSLSLPTITDGSDFTLRALGTTSICDTHFQCDEHIVRVSVLMKSH